MVMNITKENILPKFLARSSKGAWQSSLVNFNFLTNINDLKNSGNKH